MMRNSKVLADAAKRYAAEKSERELKRLVASKRIEGFSRRRRRRKILSASTAWQKWEIEFLGTDIDREVAKRIGRTHRAVAHKREKLGIPPFYDTGPRRKWTENE